MPANPLTDQLAAAAANRRRTGSDLQHAVGDELARRLGTHLAHLDQTAVGEVLLYLGQFVDGMTDQAALHPTAMSAANLGRQMSAAIALAGERLYTGSGK